MSKAERNVVHSIPRLILGRVEKVNLAQKMIKVRVERRVLHPLYGKVVMKSTALNVHWEGEQSLVVGDRVEVMESRPISKIKHHVFVRKTDPHL